MSFKLFSTRISITVPFCAILAFLFCIDRSGLMGISLASSALHEFGHLIVMRLCGIPPRRIDFGLYGIIITGAPPTSVKKELMVVAAGPAANIIAAAVLIAAYGISHGVILLHAAVINAAVAAFNLFPVQRLDGGTFFLIIFTKLFGGERGAVVLSVFSIVSAGAVTVLGVTLFSSGIKNPSLMLLGVYLTVMNIMKL